MFRSLKFIRSVGNLAKLKPNAVVCLKNVVRNSSITTWNKDWKPGPWPRTREERLAAAKKYNMIPEDYEPYPEDEGFGDYPMFKKTHMETRNPFESYDFETLKRYYGEPVHPDFDICVEDRVNFEQKHRIRPWKMMLMLFTGVSLYALIIGYTETHPEKFITIDKIPKQYPMSGVVHYTFEADE